MSNVLKRPLFSRGGYSTRPHLKRGTTIRSKLNELDLGYKPSEGIPTESTPFFGMPFKGHVHPNRNIFRRIMRPTRKSLRAGSYGLQGYLGSTAMMPDPSDLPERTEESTKTESVNVVDQDNNVETITTETPSTGNIITDGINTVIEGITGKNPNTTVTKEPQGQNIKLGDLVAPRDSESGASVAVAGANDGFDAAGLITPYNQANWGESIQSLEIDMEVVEQLKKKLEALIPDTRRQEGINLLMQLGAALMTGKTMRGGISGFLDVAGQSGLAVLPQMLEATNRQSQQDTQLALAAFNMVAEAKRSQVSNNPFGQGKGSKVKIGRIIYDPNGKDDDGDGVPNKIGVVPVGAGWGFDKEPYVQALRMADDARGAQGLYPMFTIAPFGQEGSDWSGFEVIDPSQYSTSAAGDAAMNYGNVMIRAVGRMGPFLQWATNNGLGGNENYFGIGGSLNEFLRSKISGWDQLINSQPWLTDKSQLASSHADAIEQIQSYWMSQDPNLLAERGSEGLVYGNGRPLNKDGTYTLKEGDQEIGEMYTLDRDGDGFAEEYQLKIGDTLATPQSMYASIGTTKWDDDNKKWAWQTPEIGAMEQYLNAISMVIARYKQPTGRLLADTISLSRQDVNPFGWQNPKDAIAKNYNYFKIFVEDWVRKTEKIKGVKVTAEMIDAEFGKMNANGERTGGLNMLNRTMHDMFMYDTLSKKNTGVGVLPQFVDWRIFFPGAIGIGQPGGDNGPGKIFDLHSSGNYGSTLQGIENSNMNPTWSVEDFMEDFKEEMGIE